MILKEGISGDIVQLYHLLTQENFIRNKFLKFGIE